jgi:glutathione S-transferase
MLQDSPRPSTQVLPPTKPNSYVLLAAATYGILNTVHASNTTRFRKAASIPYPLAYAPSSRTDPAAYKFNCAQRAHANYIENSPSFLVALVLAGLRYPVAAGALGVGWCVARWMYMQGYSTGAEGGKGRYKGIWFYLCHFGLVGLCGWSGVQMVRGL